METAPAEGIFTIPVEPPVSVLHWVSIKRMTSQKKSVIMAKYNPVTLTDGKPTTAATAIAARPASGKAAQIGKLSLIISRADVKALIPMKAMIPRDTWPVLAVLRHMSHEMSILFNTIGTYFCGMP